MPDNHRVWNTPAARLDCTLDSGHGTTGTLYERIEGGAVVQWDATAACGACITVGEGGRRGPTPSSGRQPTGVETTGGIGGGGVQEDSEPPSGHVA